MPTSRSSSDDWRAFAVALGHNLQRERLARGFTQDEVAYRAGLSRFTYQKYESGQSKPGQPANPTIKSLLAIAQVLEIQLESFLPTNVPDLRAR